MTNSRDVAAWLHAHDDIAILTHMQPDGDALGSSLALLLALEQQGKRAFVCCQDPCPVYLGMLPVRGRLFLPDEIPFTPRALVCVDLNDAARMGSAAALLDASKPLLGIDHHEHPRLQAELLWDCPDAAASGELVYQVVRDMGASLTDDMALCLYAAISTDTGNFSFSCTTPDCLRIVSECVSRIDLDEVNYELFRKRSQARTKLLGRALSTMSYLENGKIALIELHPGDFEACGAVQADTESIVNYGINTEGVAVAVLAVDRGDSTKFSLRSRGQVNLADLLRPMGGGGHDRAAGITLEGDFDACLERVMQAVRNAVCALS